MRFPELTLDGYVRSHFKWPWEKFEIYDPRTPWEDQETIDNRAEQAVYHNIDLTIALAAFSTHAYYSGLYAATDTYHFYRMMRAVQLSPAYLAAGLTLGIAALQADAMQEFSATEQLQILSGVSTPSSSTKHKLLSLSDL